MNNKNIARFKLFLIFAIFIGPLIGAYIWYQGLDKDYRPESMSNHGKLLLPTTPLQNFAGTGLEGNPVGLNTLKGRWTLLYALRKPCDEACRKVLYNMHQVRLALGREMSRMQRLLMLQPDYLNEQQTGEIRHDEGLLTLLYRPNGLFQQLAPQFDRHQLPPDSILLVDPNGNLVMAFPPELDPRMMLKDLKKLLKLSKIG